MQCIFISFADNIGKPRKDRPQVTQIGNLGEALGFPYLYFVDYRIIQWKKYFLCYQFLYGIFMRLGSRLTHARFICMEFNRNHYGFFFLKRRVVG